MQRNRNLVMIKYAQAGAGMTPSAEVKKESGAAPRTSRIFQKLY
jgi:hypothetical protein